MIVDSKGTGTEGDLDEEVRDEGVGDLDIEETVCWLLAKLSEVVTEQGIITEPLVQSDSVSVKVDLV